MSRNEGSRTKKFRFRKFFIEHFKKKGYTNTRRTKKFRFRKTIKRCNMVIKRDYYLNKLIAKKGNGLVKIITGVRRCGKSFLLFDLFYNHLIEDGVSRENIITLKLDEVGNVKYRNPFELDKYIKEKIKDQKKHYYVFIDEIQFVDDVENPWLKGSANKIGFVDVLLGLMNFKNLDVYITGSNSRMLSKDIVTQFRDRGDSIHLFPLSYAEYCKASKGDSEATWQDYMTYGGFPRIMHLRNSQEKVEYLKSLFSNTYLKDVLERNKIKNDKENIDDLIKIVASSVGSLTNPNKIANTFKSVKQISINSATIDLYLDYFVDAFILSKVYRYDIKGRKYIGSPLKYYFVDVGLRNALLNYRQQEENHIMENIIYNELVLRGYNVDVGAINHRYINKEGKDIKTKIEVDFIATLGNKKIYIQSALNIDSQEKRLQETASLKKINDSFKKIVVIKDDIIPWIDDYGIHYIGIRKFLTNGEDLENI